MFNSSFGRLTPDEYDEYLKESIPDRRVDPEKGVTGGFTPEEAIREAKRCMHCDCREPVHCLLRQYAGEYGAKQKHHRDGDRNKITKLTQHELVIYEPEKCIKCGLCVEITQQMGEPLGLTYIGRGFDVRVSVPFHRSIREALESTAEACAEACPTGALTKKQAEKEDLES